MTEDVTQALGTTMEAQIGAVDYRLRIPALSFSSYMRMRRVLLRQPGIRSPKRVGRSWLRALAIGGAIGAVLGVLTAVHELSAGFWIGVESLDMGWEVGGRGLLLLAFLLMVVTAVCGLLCLNRAQCAMLVKVHAAAGALYGAHLLAIGERGLVLHNVARVLFVPWSSVTRVEPDQNGIFILADHVSAFWVTENVLAALPDRAAFMAYLDRHMAAQARREGVADREPA
jgi:hypothetical protein